MTETETETRKARLRDNLDSALSNMMAVLPGADNEPGWELPTFEERRGEHESPNRAGVEVAGCRAGDG
jgi:hypothetical protein